MNIYVKDESGKWRKLVYEPARYHSFFPKPFMSLSIASTHAVCFSATTVDAEDLWMNYQDLQKNTSAWSDHYQKEHQDQHLGDRQEGGDLFKLQVRLSSNVPKSAYVNRNIFKYTCLTSLRRDIWQVLYATTFAVIALHLADLIRDQGVSVSVPFLFLIYLNVLSLYANENIVYVYESALFWWVDDLRNAEVVWVVLKGGLIASLALVLYTASKVDLRLRACPGAVFTVI